VVFFKHFETKDDFFIQVFGDKMNQFNFFIMTTAVIMFFTD